MGFKAFVIKDQNHDLNHLNTVLSDAGIEGRFLPCGLPHAVTNHSEPLDCVKLAHKASELEHLHRRLSWSEARMRHFARIAADWFWESDEDLRIIWSSGGPIREGQCLTDALNNRLKNLKANENSLDALLALRERRGFQHVVLEHASDGDLSAQAFRLSGEPVKDPDGQFAGFRGIGRDITEELRLTRQIDHDAHHDPLTGLANRREFLRRIQRAWLRARQEQVVHALCFLDLDRFKLVNDEAGHAAGDALLCQLAEAMKKQVRGADTLARMGGDEFCVLLENCALEYAIRVSEALLNTVRETLFVWNEITYQVGASIGITLITPHTDDASRALVEADVACYAAKKLGRDQVQVYRDVSSDPS